MPWFRVYIEIIDDPKIAAMTDAQKWDWIGLLAIAREAKKPGVIRMNPEQIAWRLRRTAENMRQTLDAYAQTYNEDDEPMIEVYPDHVIVTKFMDRQYDKPSDKPEAVKERVSKHRRNADETPAKRESNATDTDTDTDTDTEIKQKKRDKKEKRAFALSVHMTNEQYANLIERFGESDTKDRIERLSLYKQSKGRQYKCDYSTILNWARKEETPGSRAAAEGAKKYE